MSKIRSSFWKKIMVILPAMLAITLTTFAQSAETAEKASVSSGTLWFYFLIFSAGILFFVVINKSLRALELSYELTGKPISRIWNKVNGVFMLIFGVIFLYGTLWEINTHGKMLLPESASEQGLVTDSLFMTTLIITGIVFVLTHILLFYYGFRYKHSEKRRALWYPHNDKLEIYWTVIPAIVLTVLVVMGWKTWNGITKPAPQGAAVIEVTGKQFAWMARYPGVDNKLGTKSFKNINDLNEVGVDINDQHANDDVFTKEIHLVVNKPVRFVFGANDVIHSAYMPHFRMQMNCVPGMPTTFWMTPRTTTAEMREKQADDKFDYVLLCAKICGQAHFNMQMRVVVETQEEYNKWMATQKPYFTEDMKTQIKAMDAEKNKGKSVEGPKALAVK